MNESFKSFVDFDEIGGPVAKSIQTIIALIGFICNILAICVFERKELKKRSYSIYWKLKALFENIILLNVFQNSAISSFSFRQFSAV